MKALLADDHPLMREGVRHVLSRLAPYVAIVDAHDYPSLFEQSAAHPDLDLAVVDLTMPGFAGAEGIVEYRSRFPDVPVVVVSASESPHDIRNVLEAGALGFIPKAASSETMLAALQQVLKGSVYIPTGVRLPGALASGTPTRADPAQPELTARQLEVAHLLAVGCTNKAIASMLALSEGTVKVHIAAIFRALNVSNRTEAVLAIQRLTGTS